VKPAVILLVVFLGSVVGAGGAYVLGEVVLDDADEVAAHTIVELPRGEIELLREENVALARRVGELESQGSSSKAPQRPIRDVLVDEEFRLNLLEQARSAAREEATAAATELVSKAAADSSLANPENSRAALIGQMLNQLTAEEEGLRRDAIRNLRLLRAVEARKQVLGALSDSSQAVKLQAAAYFEVIWDPEALQPLVKLMNEQDPIVGEMALDALNESHDEQAVKELENYYMRGPNMLLVYEAGKALEENNRKDLIPPGVPRIRATLSDADAHQRRYAVICLRRWGSKEDIPAVEALKQDPDLQVRQAVQWALRDWGVE
jgi:HEAT repeat protein